MAEKIFRDPLYNYISIDTDRDNWLMTLVDTPEVQRLRRIRQLGVSNYTYPGAEHSRFSHSLGVLHLMFQAIDRLEKLNPSEQVRRYRPPLLAAALLHDIGHGPFSHLFESCLGTKHEDWSVKIIQDSESGVHRALAQFSPTLPQEVAGLVDKSEVNSPPWAKYLLSSELDMDRLDYLRRDSLFTGSGYGHYDFYRILNTFHLIEDDGSLSIAWPEKAKLAIEEYIFARYYMYQNVYLHKTTRGIEKVVEAAWRRARSLYQDGAHEILNLLPSIQQFWCSENPSSRDFLRIEESTILYQMQIWEDCSDRTLKDLAGRFRNRTRFRMIEPPVAANPFSNHEEWDRELHALIAGQQRFEFPEYYCLCDRVKAKYNLPYHPEKEKGEQSLRTAIRILVDNEPR